jgi:hypothetical protein
MLAMVLILVVACSADEPGGLRAASSQGRAAHVNDAPSSHGKRFPMQHTTVVLQENGTGSLNGGQNGGGLAADPGPGGLTSALVFNLLRLFSAASLVSGT